MNCYNCGAEYSKNNIFCLECGAELTDKIFNNNVEYYNDCLNIKLCGNTISFSAEILEYNELFGNFITLGDKQYRFACFIYFSKNAENTIKSVSKSKGSCCKFQVLL